MSVVRFGLVTISSLAAVCAVGCGPRQTYEQTYLRADDNWTFRREYSRADRLFNAFDYGHAVLSETFLRHPADAPARLEGDEYAFITTNLLRSPPRVPLDERAIAPTYSVELPEAIETFEWTHLLHRQLYDIVADEHLSPTQRDDRVAAALQYYRSRRDLALSSTPKAMSLMEGQPYSLAFRRAAPRFNRLIWSYHWMQMGIYDAMLDARDHGDRVRRVDATVDRFFSLVADTTGALTVMPMSPAIAPHFTELYPEAAIIFDNLHSLHDVVSDILASAVVPPDHKRDEVLQALAHYRDATTLATSRDEWREMSRAMGVEHMGGAVPRAP